MIDFLRGTIAHRETEYVVLDVNGVGYRVFCANPFAAAPGREGKDGAQVTMYIHYHVREDAHLLFGFPTREEQSLFRLLLDVSGIGPKVAIGVLAGGKPETIASAIRQENLSFLTKLPGIGRKTAQRMVLDLKDKLGAFTGGLEEQGFWATEMIRDEQGSTGTWAEAKAALLALGYTEGEADRAGAAIRSKLTGLEGTDAVIKLALQALFKLSQ